MSIDTKCWDTSELVDSLRGQGAILRVEGCPGQGCEIVDVNLHGKRLSEELLTLLCKLTYVRRIDLSLTNLTDSMLMALAALRTIEELVIYHTPTTTAGIDAFRRAKSNCRLVIATQ